VVALSLPVAALSLVLGWAVWVPDSSVERRALDWPHGLDRTEAGARLEELGLVSNGRLFSVYLAVFARSVEIEPGPHLLELPLAPRDLLQRLARLPSRPSLGVTVPEGYTSFQIARRFDERGICSEASFLAAASDPGLRQRLGVAAASLEGYLFPATYEARLDEAPERLLQMMVGEARRRLRRLFDRHRDGVARLRSEHGFGEHEVLTLASMVEKEASVPDERRLIASVFFNRLSSVTFRPRRMLQSDPTAAYGCISAARLPSCRGFSGRVRPEMLRDRQNPYNTYQHPGLPPGPIANPGEAAIEAVLSPASTDYLFFVAIGGGRHRFSRSFEEHALSIQRLRGLGSAAPAPSGTAD
jgi:UPF0755 protein